MARAAARRSDQPDRASRKTDRISGGGGRRCGRCRVQFYTRFCGCSPSIARPPALQSTAPPLHAAAFCPSARLVSVTLASLASSNVHPTITLADAPPRRATSSASCRHATATPSGRRTASSTAAASLPLPCRSCRCRWPLVFVTQRQVVVFNDRPQNSSRRSMFRPTSSTFWSACKVSVLTINDASCRNHR